MTPNRRTPTLAALAAMFVFNLRAVPVRLTICWGLRGLILRLGPFGRPCFALVLAWFYWHVVKPISSREKVRRWLLTPR